MNDLGCRFGGTQQGVETEAQRKHQAMRGGQDQRGWQNPYPSWSHDERTRLILTVMVWSSGGLTRVRTPVGVWRSDRSGNVARWAIG